MSCRHRRFHESVALGYNDLRRALAGASACRRFHGMGGHFHGPSLDGYTGTPTAAPPARLDLRGLYSTDSGARHGYDRTDAAPRHHPANVDAELLLRDEHDGVDRVCNPEYRGHLYASTHGLAPTPDVVRNGGVDHHGIQSPDAGVAAIRGHESGLRHRDPAIPDCRYDCGSPPHRPYPPGVALGFRRVGTDRSDD